MSKKASKKEAGAGRILVPVDFSEQCRIALQQACNLGAQTGAKIYILHVIEETGSFFKFLGEDQMKILRNEVEKELKKLCDSIVVPTGLECEYMIGRGKVADKVAEIAELIAADFIVMGTYGTDNLKKKFIGSNALRVVRESRVPVITIHGKKHRKGCKNIVLPLDLTKETREKVNRCIDFARLYNATVRVVSVQFTTDEFVVNRLTRQMTQVHAFIEKAGVKVTSEIIKGIKGEESFAQCILDFAKKVDGDLIMIMTQQEQDWTPYFIGSSAQSIINHSTIPVLSLIPEPKKDMSVFKPY
jgi:nucleotide-binding universal stress UspA family protein